MREISFLADLARIGRAWRWLACVAVLHAVSPEGSGATYRRGAVGSIEVLTSDSPEHTKWLVCEVRELRRQMQVLFGAVPLPDPRMHIVIFKSLEDFRSFVPAEQDFGLYKDQITTGSFTYGDSGLTFAIVRDENFDRIRQVMLMSYASYLLQSAAPRAPLWIQLGLPEFFSTTECRLNKVYLGQTARNHASNIRASKLLPLAKLTDDAEMRRYINTYTRDTVLYHESWALWHQWLTDEKADHHEQIQRLLAAVRQGEPGNAATLSASFRLPLEAIEGAHRNRKSIGGWRVVVANTNADDLVAGLTFTPADDLDIKSSLAHLFGRAGKGLGTLGYELLRLAVAQPESPRPAEALAVLAEGEHDEEGALRHWERARELNTDNAFAYLVAVRESIRGRPLELSLRGDLPEAIVETQRALLRRCLALDPGQAEAQYYRVWVEAFAPEPRRDIVEEVVRSRAAELRPAMSLTLAIARWRLGERAAAHQLLADYQARQNTSEKERGWACQLDGVMLAAEQPAS